MVNFGSSRLRRFLILSAVQFFLWNLAPSLFLIFAGGVDLMVYVFVYIFLAPGIIIGTGWLFSQFHSFSKDIVTDTFLSGIFSAVLALGVFFGVAPASGLTKEIYYTWLGFGVQTVWQMKLNETYVSSVFYLPILSLVILIAPTISLLMGAIWHLLLDRRIAHARDSRIEKLEKVVRENEEWLVQRSDLKEKISQVISLDPANLGLRATVFRREAETIDDEQIQRRIVKLDGEIAENLQSRRETEEKLNVLAREKKALENESRKVENKLSTMKDLDPANIGIRLDKLLSEWEKMNQQKLENIKAVGEIERLIKKKLLIRFRMETADEETGKHSNEMNYLQFTESTLALEKSILQLEEMDRAIEGERQHPLDARSELKRLRAARV